MELRQLRYFAEVARRGGFRRAADALGVAQPAISHQVQRLEAELGVTLLERGRPGVRTTAAGEAFLARAERILGEVDAARAEMDAHGGALAGVVRVGAWHSSAPDVPGLVREFSAANPGIEMLLYEDTAERMIGMVRDGDLDVAVVILAEPLDLRGLTVEPVLTEPLVVGGAPDGPLGGRRRVRLADLRDEPFVMFPPGSAMRGIVEQACAQQGFRPRIVVEAMGFTAARALASRGLGIAFLPRSMPGEPGPPLAVAATSPELTRTSALAWRARGALSPAAAAFLDHARGRLATAR
ncbi:MAG: LysR family transcriptional regulator [Thermoleophilia bacterium]